MRQNNDLACLCKSIWWCDVFTNENLREKVAQHTGVKPSWGENKGGNLMCAKEIRCLLTLRKELVVDERNEALDSSLQRRTYAYFLTWECRHCMWWMTVSAGKWQCDAVTKHAELTGYFSQDPNLLDVCNSYIFSCDIPYSGFSRRHLLDRDCQWSEQMFPWRWIYDILDVVRW